MIALLQRHKICVESDILGLNVFRNASASLLRFRRFSSSFVSFALSFLWPLLLCLDDGGGDFMPPVDDDETPAAPDGGAEACMSDFFPPPPPLDCFRLFLPDAAATAADSPDISSYIASAFRASATGSSSGDRHVAEAVGATDGWCCCVAAALFFFGIRPVASMLRPLSETVPPGCLPLLIFLRTENSQT